MEATENGVLKNKQKNDMKNTENLTKTSKEVEEVEVNQFERIEMKKYDERFEPFMLVGKENDYMLTLGNTAVWDEKIKKVEEAATLLQRMPWKLVLIASKVYSEYVNEYIKKVSK